METRVQNLPIPKLWAPSAQDLSLSFQPFPLPALRLTLPPLRRPLHLLTPSPSPYLPNAHEWKMQGTEGME